MDINTIRVLSLDGGGIRGVITSTFLELFCNLAGIPGNQLYKYFDIITGTSIGGIQALGYAYGIPPSQLKQILINNGSTIFNCTYPIPGGGQAGYGTWAGYLSGLYSSLYSNIPLQSVIFDTIGDIKLSDLKTKVLIPSFQTLDSNGNPSNIPIYFSNISNTIVPILKGQDFLAIDVAMSTSAAPLYFPPYSFGGATYIDGGVFLNNPVSFALNVMKAVKPIANRFCVLSIGTGLGSIGYIPSDQMKFQEKSIKSFNNLKVIKSVLDISMNIPPEGVSKELEILSKYTLSNLYYERGQYIIPIEQEPDSSLDNASPEFIAYMQQSATDYFNNNLNNISNFIGHLLL